MEPFEVVAAPFTIYVAPVGTAFPDVTVDPPADWMKLGTSGTDNYTEDGVTVTHEQTVEVFRSLGSTGPRKAWRTEEGLLIGFTLVDLSAEQYAKVLNDASVTQNAAGAGTGGTDVFGLSRGQEVAAHALLARGDASPAGDAFVTQYEVPRVFQNSEPELTFQKGDPAGHECEFMALEDLNAANARERFGRLVIQTAAAS